MSIFSSQCAIIVIFIYKITEVKMCVSLRDHHDLTLILLKMTLLHIRHV